MFADTATTPGTKSSIAFIPSTLVCVCVCVCVIVNICSVLQIKNTVFVAQMHDILAIGDKFGPTCVAEVVYLAYASFALVIYHPVA